MRVHLSFDIGYGAVHFSYLPLSHVFERLVTEGMLAGGGEIRFMRWNPSSKVTSPYLLEDLKAARPTLFTAAPRVLEKIRSGLEGKVKAAGGIKAKVRGREERSDACLDFCTRRAPYQSPQYSHP